MKPLTRYDTGDLRAARRMLDELTPKEKMQLLRTKPVWPRRPGWMRRNTHVSGTSFDPTFLAGVARHVL